MNRKAARLAVWLLLATGIGLAIFYRDRFDIAVLQQWLNQAGSAAPLLFIGVYVPSVCLFPVVLLSPFFQTLRLLVLRVFLFFCSGESIVLCCEVRLCGHFQY